MPFLTTERLLLRPLSLFDAEAIQDLFPNWETVRFLSTKVPWPYPSDGALTFIRDVALPGMGAGREWHWSIRLREKPDQLIGVVSLMDKTNCNRAFWLAPRWRGQGLMLEATNAATRYWFAQLNRPRLREPKAAINHPSRRLSRNIGMRVVKFEEQNFVIGRLSTEIWEITQEDWFLYCANPF
ncbi:N-acetyltransferase [Methylobacterium nonmethylotrophicum]|uniref:N-acetyltransferase n=1 Tax=Methylobacterium nonmethylotrophicum TaxID=1141884 RepID=A0A4Z0NE02_9HYPH|nr:N-acetyltransferase [Methylobacterium nonmethylotrophicum]